ncbi:hypothetical protein N3K66_006621 [Trichothecium roseum]|uniref:Uncharacterized protein n=1 Tax=Trichothecium roseum TaxID=47278 RepID=A0ACC0UX27_9HYPO|nr:hypothetical protein N3K66_006621 [Trichothecium roseum]
MASRSIFRVLSPRAAEGAAAAGPVARLGCLEVPNRKPIQTPSYTAFASRGVIPHVTSDNVTRYTKLDSAYMALEDFVEKKEPPMISMPAGGLEGSRLHAFTAFPRDTAVILAPRRCPPVEAPSGNTSKHAFVFTSMGFRRVTVAEYASWTDALQADVVVPLADLPPGKPSSLSAKRLDRMMTHTEDWLEEFLALSAAKPEHGNQREAAAASLFAPVPPVPYAAQRNYLDYLADLVGDGDSDGSAGGRGRRIKGLAVYGADLLPDLAGHAALGHLPRLSLDSPPTPHEILRQVSLGADMVLTPLVNNASDAGVALTFSLPAPGQHDEQQQQQQQQQPLPLGEDMWDERNKDRVESMVPGCPCYTCTAHHRAFVNHLLHAKEMLGWTLLQVHNHHVMAAFLAAVRMALAAGGPAALEEARLRFAGAYEADLPAGTGERPRARGYHFKSGEGNARSNRPAWQAGINGVAAVDEAAAASDGDEGKRDEKTDGLTQKEE